VFSKLPTFNLFSRDTGFPVRTGEITFPLEYYKFVVLEKRTRKCCYWETADNRVINGPYEKKNNCMM
jgi:hypothetical protein